MPTGLTCGLQRALVFHATFPQPGTKDPPLPTVVATAAWPPHALRLPLTKPMSLSLHSHLPL